MVSENIKNELRLRLSAIAAGMPGFRSRFGQRSMIAEVAKTLSECPDPATEGKQVNDKHHDGRNLLCLSGGTGVGKSLGYSLPGAVMSKHKGKKLVISTAMVGLQEQLIKRDLPRFLALADLPMSIVLAKGRTRYICNYRLQKLVEGMTRSEGSSNTREVASSHIAERMAQDLRDNRWDGDRDSYESVNDEFWSLVTTDQYGCLGASCPSARSCAQKQAKKQMKAADIIVANHDLVLADLAMGGGKVLPAPEECFYVFDEAHHLPEKAVTAFASSHKIGSDLRLMVRIRDFAAAAKPLLVGQYPDELDMITKASGRLSGFLRDTYSFFDSLEQLKPSPERPKPVLDFQRSCIPEDFFSLGEEIVATCDTLSTAISACNQSLAGMINPDGEKQEKLEKLVSDSGQLLSRVARIGTTWNLFMAEPDITLPPIAKWIESIQSETGLDYFLNASPVRAAGHLHEMLWTRAAGVVLTSASIETLGSFEDFLASTGLDRFSAVRCVSIPSPFNYETQGVLEIPEMPTPKNYEAHTAAVTQRIIAAARSLAVEGMLVLFASKKQMLDVATRMPDDVKSRLLLQGDDAKSALIQKHQARIDSGKASVIFGLESFSEGIDLAGRYCTYVIATKIPFEVPDTPVLKALADWIERRGGDPFKNIFLPLAARKLEQRIGRLIRNETDTGKIEVLDPRLWKTGYGRSILKSLPKFRLIAYGQERAFR